MSVIKCEMCGSNRLIKKDGLYQCEFCGTKYTPDEAKKLIITGSVEITKKKKKKERCLNNIYTLIKLNQISKAYQSLNNLIIDYPNDYRGWWLLYKLSFNDFLYNDSNLCFPETRFSKELENAFKLHDLHLEYDELWKQICSAYFKKCEKPGFDFKSLQKDAEPQIPNSYYSKIKNDATNKINASNLIVNFLNNNISNNLAFKILESHGIDKQTIKSMKSEVKQRIHFNKSVSFNINMSIFTKVIGNTVYWYSDNWDSHSHHYCVLSTPISYKDLGLCQYCGGTFKGVFTKTCSKCGRPKDY